MKKQYLLQRLAVTLLSVILLMPALTVSGQQSKTKRKRKKAATEKTTEVYDAAPAVPAVPRDEIDEGAEDETADETLFPLEPISLRFEDFTVETSSHAFDANEFAADNTPEVYDSIIALWYERNVSNSFDTFFKEFIDLDSTATLHSDIPDSVYSARLKMIVSPINLGYNDIVKRYIIAYTQTRKSTMAKILGLSQVYFPMIDEELAAAGLPLELRMLPVIESALNPNAVSRMGATGLWQFMYGTGKAYGLEITSFIDQRRDPSASTKAACRYLEYLYNIYNDWTLALAAYNCGPGNVNKAIKRAGGNARTFWDIYPYLPRETRGYVPAFIGATYAFTFHRQHDIEPIVPGTPICTDTIHVNRLMHFEQIASTTGTPVEVLRELNPQYKMDIIPAVERTYILTLPQSEIAKYLNYEEEIHAKDTVYLAQYLKRDPKTNTKEFQVNSVEYRVKSGDNLGAIAKKYGVTVSQLIKWNNIKNPNALRIGQRIEIYK